MTTPPFPFFPVGGTTTNKKPAAPTLLGAIANVQANKRVTSPIPAKYNSITLPKGIDFAGLKKLTDALASTKRVTSPIPAKATPVASRIPMPMPKPTPKQAVGHLVANLPPGIDFAALKAADDAKKKGGVTLPPGINFAALAAASKPPAAPTDALADIYNKFNTEMQGQSKNATARLDALIKEAGGYYDQAAKDNAAAYAPVEADLANLVKNVGGPADKTTYGDVSSAVAQLKSLLANEKAGNQGSLVDLKAAAPVMYEALSQGLQGNYLDAQLARAQMIAQQQAAASAARSGGGGGGGGGGRRSSSRRSSSRRGSSSGGGSGSSYPASANEVYTSYDDFGDIMNDPYMSADQKAEAARQIIYGKGNANNVMVAFQKQMDALARKNTKSNFGKPGSFANRVVSGALQASKNKKTNNLAYLMAAFLPHTSYLGGAQVKRTVTSKGKS